MRQNFIKSNSRNKAQITFLCFQNLNTAKICNEVCASRKKPKTRAGTYIPMVVPSARKRP